MRVGLGKRLWLIGLLLVASLVPTAGATRADTTDCADDSTCSFPSPSECAAGGHTGAWDGGPPGRGAVCADGAGHIVAYVGGHPSLLCGTIIVADVNVLDGPTAGRGSDPNQCPYTGWAAPVHDPMVAREGAEYFLYGTGPGIPTWRSTDLATWTPAGTAFTTSLPAWAATTIPGSSSPWAPDVSFFGGTWHLYYAVSTFGAKNSAIGLATSPTLDPDDPAFGWSDQGVVVRSTDTSDYNAIDPNVFIDAAGKPWLTWGSFGGGIKQAPIDPATGMLAHRLVPLFRTLAARAVPTWGIEAAFLVQRDGWFYLFVSFDNCCRGADSTYNVRVGRSRQHGGPFVDDAGVPMLAGGGRLVLAGTGDRRGPGHNAVVRDADGGWHIVFHYYDAAAAGASRLGVLPITWTDDGWPSVDWSS
jgi:arabinan endo-1,5-alpha-L-arabinosidase